MVIIPEINKDKSIEQKGIAILFMMFGHLMTDSVSSYLSRCMGPVAFFLVLSGYGMYVVNQKKDTHRWSRITRLLVNYWVVLSLVLFIGHWSNPEYYNISITELLGNITAVNPTYIPEVWFLPPYILLAISGRWIITLLNKFRGRYIFFTLFSLSVVTSLIISRYGSTYLYGHRFIYVLFCYFHLMFPFTLGVLMARNKGMGCSKFKFLSRIGTNTWLLFLIALMALRCIINTSIIHPLYVFLFFFVYLKLSVPHPIETVLRRLGKCSMNMWFIHTSAFIYLWQDRPLMDLHPIIYFIIAVALSWMLAEIIIFLYTKVFG